MVIHKVQTFLTKLFFQICFLFPAFADYFIVTLWRRRLALGTTQVGEASAHQASA